MGWPPPEIGLAPAFLGQVLRSGDSAFVVSFNDTAHLNAKPTDDQSTLARVLQQIGGMQARGGTALYDSIEAACRLPDNPNFHRVLVVLTDGQDDASRNSQEETLDVARRTGTALYFIGPDVERGPMFQIRNNRGPDVLKEMASAAGGVYFRASSKRDAESAFDSLVHILRAQYALDFQPSLLPKKDRQIRVRCSRKGVRLIAPDLLAK